MRACVSLQSGAEHGCGCALTVLLIISWRDHYYRIEVSPAAVEGWSFYPAFTPRCMLLADSARPDFGCRVSRDRDDSFSRLCAVSAVKEGAVDCFDLQRREGGEAREGGGRDVSATRMCIHGGRLLTSEVWPLSWCERRHEDEDCDGPT